MGEPDAALAQAAACLPRMLRAAALSLPEAGRKCEEISLRAGRGAFWTAEGVERPQGGDKPLPVTEADLRLVAELATQPSFHAALEKLRDGFLPLTGGHRLGLCGTAVVRDGAVVNLRELSSANLRIARAVEGAADQVLPLLRREDGVKSTLILSPPGGGKTTLLRDLIQALSQGRGGPPLRVGLADERGEVAALREGTPMLDVGPRTDVMDGCPKHLALMFLLRSMGPQVLAADEITAPEDGQAMSAAAHCGVSLLATAHGAELADLRRRPLYRRLLEEGLFQAAVIIRREGGRRRCQVEALS